MKLFRVLAADRKRSIYLSGLCLSVVGLVLVLSVLVTVAGHLGNLAPLRGRGFSIAFRAISGIVVAGIGFAAMTVAVHTANAAELQSDAAEHDEAPRRSDQNRELLLRVGEDDANVLDDVRRWPKLAMPRKLAFANMPSIGRRLPTSAPTPGASEERQLEGTIVVVKIRCRDCRRLSSEEASYCEHCSCRL